MTQQEYTPFIAGQSMGSANPRRIIINLNEEVVAIAYYSGAGLIGRSLPPYIWNGTGYNYVTEISNHGWLGYINCMLITQMAP